MTKANYKYGNKFPQVTELFSFQVEQSKKNTVSEVTLTWFLLCNLGKIINMEKERNFTNRKLKPL